MNWSRFTLFYGFDNNAITIIMAILLILVLIYTMLGGMISVIITDYIQYLILSVGFLEKWI